MSLPPALPGRRFAPGPLLRSIAELDDAGVTRETAFRVEGARVVFADHDLIRHDFPELTEAAAIDAWLTRRAAVISGPNAQPNDVTSPVRCGEPVAAYRPTRYGRALVMPASDDEGGGLLDVKGAGVAPGRLPRWARHGSGTCELAEVLTDLLVQRIVDEIFSRAAPDLGTVPVYGVIDLGFDVRSETHDDGARVPAGCLVRRAHRRAPRALEIPRAGSPEEHAKAEVEMLLRSYGITSSNLGSRLHVRDEGGRLEARYGAEELGGFSDGEVAAIRDLARVHAPFEARVIEALNVQLTREVALEPTRATLVDFGHYRFVRRFERPVVSLVRGRLLRWGAALWPESSSFVQPDPELAVSPALWGVTAADDELALALRLHFEGFACRLRAGAVTPADVSAEIERCLACVTARWDLPAAP